MFTQFGFIGFAPEASHELTQNKKGGPQREPPFRYSASWKKLHYNIL
jgi:hypothetical protein